MDAKTKLQALTGGKALDQKYTPAENPSLAASSTMPPDIYEDLESDEEVLMYKKPVLVFEKNGVVISDDGSGKRIDTTSSAMTSNAYEATESDEENMLSLNKKVGTLDLKTGVITAAEGSQNRIDTTSTVSFKQLLVGELAPEGVRFVPFKTVVRYPFMFAGNTNRKKVADKFFDRGQVYGHTWEIFYLYADKAGHNQQAILLVATTQFQRFLEEVNSKLKIRLTIPKGNSGDLFYIGFMNDGTPQPRFLGRSTTREEYDDLKFRIPPYDFTLVGEPTALAAPTDQALATFQEKWARMTGAGKSNKSSKAAKKDRKLNDQITRTQVWGSDIKRVQCYIGIRTTEYEDKVRAELEKKFGSWVDQKEVEKKAAATYQNPTFFQLDRNVRHKPQDSAVFIAVDIEANELNHNQITEIGIATLDTFDIVKVPPGVGGKNWFQMIRARHFRILEHQHLVNYRHVSGCPDRFEFGDSEFVSLRDAPIAVASCFRHPFLGENRASLGEQLRNIVLVGHSIGGDVTYLKKLGYDVSNLSNLLDTVDTGDMWKYHQKASQPRNLGAVLHDLGITAWNLHNAGNDAVYTLQAMIGIAIKHLTDKLPESSEKHNKERFATNFEKVSENMNKEIV